MKPARRLVLFGLPLVAAAALAQPVAPGTPRDPWVPPAARQPAPTCTTGAALQQQVERKLRAGFDAADAARAGRITRAQARAAGLGFVDRHFEQIDSAGSGTVSFEEVKGYLRRRGAAL